METTPDQTSFLFDIKEWDVFYYVDIELFPEDRTQEYSHVDFYELTARGVTDTEITYETFKVSGWSRPSMANTEDKRDMATRDLMNDLSWGYKRNKEQAIYFVKAYRDMFINEDPAMAEKHRIHCLKVLNEALDVIEWRLIIK